MRFASSGMLSAAATLFYYGPLFGGTASMKPATTLLFLPGATLTVDGQALIRRGTLVDR
jgi:hypothetical protein